MSEYTAPKREVTKMRLGGAWRPVPLQHQGGGRGVRPPARPQAGQPPGAAYVEFLEGSYYVGVHRSKTRSYKDATAALTGVYATDTTYGDKLNSIIEQYQLTIYDTY